MNRITSVIGISILGFALPFTAQETAPKATTARKDCEELKMEIAAKLDAKSVKNYELTVVKAQDVKDEQVVGSCDGGTRRVTY